jgi:hypothetical protein
MPSVGGCQGDLGKKVGLCEGADENGAGIARRFCASE